MSSAICTVHECERPSNSRGMCSMHYQRWNRYGRTGKKYTPSPLERFWAMVSESETGCWVWNGSINAKGYGKFSVGKRMVLAHRFSYENLVATIPEGLQIDHLCRNRSCVNPAHMEPVTARENTMRGETIPAAHAVKTHCPNNHEYTAENTRTEANGSRHCRACAANQESNATRRNT